MTSGLSMRGLLAGAVPVLLVVVGYRWGTVGGLFVMALGVLLASLLLRIVFDQHGSRGPDASQPSQVIGDAAMYQSYGYLGTGSNDPGAGIDVSVDLGGIGS